MLDYCRWIRYEGQRVFIPGCYGMIGQDPKDMKRYCTCVKPDPRLTTAQVNAANRIIEEISRAVPCGDRGTQFISYIAAQLVEIPIPEEEPAHA